MDEREKVAVSGASGLVGSALVPTLERNGYEVLRLVRRAPRADGEVRWNPDGGTIDRDGLRGVSGVIHLAGDNVASGRWTEAKKARIRNSRVQGTALLARALAELSPKPRVLVSASAIGYYGVRGNEVLDETASQGSGFLASVCGEWEAAAEPAREAGIRVVHPRIGIVLAANGGALAKMKMPFLFGVGGPIGDGSQYMSWITLEDLVSALVFALENDALVGPVNYVSPTPVKNADFTSALGRVLKRPTALPVPKFALRLGAGAEMANEMLIGGTRVVPSSLHAHGFRWEHTRVEPALDSLL
ncbi:MAG: TIGR01777 family oxidoreductase [Deltaproteobacteria bacterium]|nr:TIGR01777 family oxidoreductase [Deltaproteobacteria bacterium]